MHDYYMDLVFQKTDICYKMSTQVTTALAKKWNFINSRDPLRLRCPRATIILILCHFFLMADAFGLGSHLNTFP